MNEDYQHMFINQEDKNQFIEVNLIAYKYYFDFIIDLLEYSFVNFLFMFK